MSTPFGHATKLMEQFSGLNEAQVHSLFSGGYFPDLAWAAQHGCLPSRDEFQKVLGINKNRPQLQGLGELSLPDRTMSLGARVDAGRYGRRDARIGDQYFRLTLPAGNRRLVLAYFKPTSSPVGVGRWAVANGYSLALIDDLLVVGCHPEYGQLQRKFRIVALGSRTVVQGCRATPFLGMIDTDRFIGLRCEGSDPDPEARFLLVKKAA